MKDIETKEFISSVVFILCVIAIIILCLRNCDKDAEEKGIKTTHMKSYLGKKIVMHKDTLLITDFNMYDNTYTINGKFTINANLIDSLMIK
jgi:hypothetical protein